MAFVDVFVLPLFGMRKHKKKLTLECCVYILILCKHRFLDPPRERERHTANSGTLFEQIFMSQNIFIKHQNIYYKLHNGNFAQNTPLT